MEQNILPATKVNFDNVQVAFAAKNEDALRQAYLLFGSMNFPWLVKSGTWLVSTALKVGLPVKGLLKKTLFRQFCGGENLKDCEKTIRELSRFGIGTILDYSAEGATSEKGFDKTEQEIIATIHKAAISLDIPFAVFKVTGIADSKLLEKVQSKQTLSAKEEEAFQRIQNRVDRICKTAFEKNVPIFIDAEDSWIQAPIDEMAYEMMKKYNKERAIVHNTFQMYLKNKLEELKRATYYAAMHQYYLGAKLVRGAYMEKERERAKQKGYADPVQPNKEASDKAYDQAQKYCIQNKKKISMCSGTHNEHSCYYLTILMEKYNVKNNDPHVWFAQLYGMSDHISYNLAQAGYNVAKYVPYGPVEEVLPYLFRRAEENTAMAGQGSREYRLVKAEVKRRKLAKATN